MLGNYEFKMQVHLPVKGVIITFGDQCSYAWQEISLDVYDLDDESIERHSRYEIEDRFMYLGNKIYPYGVFTVWKGKKAHKVLRCFYIPQGDNSSVLHFDWVIGSSKLDKPIYAIHQLEHIGVQSPFGIGRKMKLARCLDMFSEHVPHYTEEEF
jgi:hypothetical protein